MLGTICVNISFLRFVVNKSNLRQIFPSYARSKSKHPRKSKLTKEPSKSKSLSSDAGVSSLSLPLQPNPPTSTSARMPSTSSKANFHELGFQKAGRKMSTSSSKESPTLSRIFQRLGLKVRLQVFQNVGGNVWDLEERWQTFIFRRTLEFGKLGVADAGNYPCYLNFLHFLKFFEMRFLK